MNTTSDLSPVEPSSSGGSNTGRIILIVLGGVAALCTCGIIAVAAVLFYFGQAPDNVSIQYDMPFTVTEGDEFDLVITLTNTGTEPVYIGDIDLDEAFDGSILDGTIVIDTDPAMTRDFSISGIKSFEYNRDLSPNEPATVTFTLEAVTPGEFGGSVAAYAGDQGARINYVGITIRER